MKDRSDEPPMQFAQRMGAVSSPILVGLAIIPLALAAWGTASLLTPSPSRPEMGQMLEEGEWFTVKPRSFDLTIISAGELEAKEQLEIKSQIKGETLILELVDEGTFVNSGQLLLRLDADEIETNIEQERLNVESARAEKIAAEQDLEIETNKAESDQKEAEVKLDLARLDLAKWVSGEVPQKRRELKLDLERAERKLTRAKRDNRLSQELYAERFISQNELEESEDAVIDSEDDLATGILNIEVYNSYTHQREEKQKNSEVEQAEAELQRTQKKNQSKIAAAQAELESKRHAFKIRDDRLVELRDQLIKCQIFAPQDGMVVYATSVGRRHRRGDPIMTGRRVWYNEKLILLPDTTQMIATLRVHEALMPQIALGQLVTISVDAMPGQIFEGKIVEVSVMAQDGGWINPNLREYKVKAVLPTEIAGLKPAMRCSAEIVTGHVQEAIAVPVQAVFSEAEEHFCYVPAGRNSIQRTPVTLGRASESFVEIVKGLKSGDTVLLRHPRPGEEIS